MALRIPIDLGFLSHRGIKVVATDYRYISAELGFELSEFGMVVTRSGKSTDVPRNRDTDMIKKVRGRKVKEGISKSHVTPHALRVGKSTCGMKVAPESSASHHREAHRRAYSTGIVLYHGPTDMSGELSQDERPMVETISTEIVLEREMECDGNNGSESNNVTDSGEAKRLPGSLVSSGVKLPQPMDDMDDIIDDPEEQGRRHGDAPVIVNARLSEVRDLMVDMGLPRGSYSAGNTVDEAVMVPLEGAGRMDSGGELQDGSSKGTPLRGLEGNASACIVPLISLWTGRWARSHRSREFGCVPAKFPNSLGPLRCILDKACEGSPGGNGQPLDAICEGVTPIGRLVRVQMQ
ncbi:hypothetical protein FOZ60_015335, partial [Perkinsus olseni]